MAFTTLLNKTGFTTLELMGQGDELQEEYETLKSDVSTLKQDIEELDIEALNEIKEEFEGITFDELLTESEASMLYTTLNTTATIQNKTQFIEANSIPNETDVTGVLVVKDMDGFSNYLTNANYSEHKRLILNSDAWYNNIAVSLHAGRDTTSPRRCYIDFAHTQNIDYDVRFITSSDDAQFKCSRGGSQVTGFQFDNFLTVSAPSGTITGTNVLSNNETRLSTAEGDIDTLQSKTQYQTAINNITTFTGDLIANNLLANNETRLSGVESTVLSHIIDISTLQEKTQYQSIALNKTIFTGSLGIGAEPNCVFDIGGSETINPGISLFAGFTDNTNAIRSVQFRNITTGTNGEMRFVACANDTNYVAFTCPSSNNTSTGFFGVQKGAGNFIFSSGGTRDMYIGPLTNSKLVLGTQNLRRLTILGDGKIGIMNDTPTQALDVTGNILSSGTITGSNITSTNSTDITTTLTRTQNITATSGNTQFTGTINNYILSSSSSAFNKIAVVSGDGVLIAGKAINWYYNEGGGTTTQTFIGATGDLYHMANLTAPNLTVTNLTDINTLKTETQNISSSILDTSTTFTGSVLASNITSTNSTDISTSLTRTQNITGSVLNTSTTYSGNIILDANKELQFLDGVSIVGRFGYNPTYNHFTINNTEGGGTVILGGVEVRHPISSYSYTTPLVTFNNSSATSPGGTSVVNLLRFGSKYDPGTGVTSMNWNINHLANDTSLRFSYNNGAFTSSISTSGTSNLNTTIEHLTISSDDSRKAERPVDRRAAQQLAEAG